MRAHVSHMERPLYISATQLVTVYACNGASQFRLCRCMYASVHARSERTKNLSQGRRSCTASRIYVHEMRKIHCGRCTVRFSLRVRSFSRVCVRLSQSSAFFIALLFYILFRNNEAATPTDTRARGYNYVVSQTYRGSIVILGKTSSVMCFDT